MPTSQLVEGYPAIFAEIVDKVGVKREYFYLKGESPTDARGLRTYFYRYRDVLAKRKNPLLSAANQIVVRVDGDKVIFEHVENGWLAKKMYLAAKRAEKENYSPPLPPKFGSRKKPREESK